MKFIYPYIINQIIIEKLFCAIHQSCNDQQDTDLPSVSSQSTAHPGMSGGNYIQCENYPSRREKRVVGDHRKGSF